MILETYFLVLLVGLLAGIAGALLGVGGGFLMVPALILIFGAEPERAVGTSLAVIIFTSVSSTIAYSRQRNIRYKTGLLLEAGVIPGGILGSYLTLSIRGNLLGGLFGLFVIAVSALMLFSGKDSKRAKGGSPVNRTSGSLSTQRSMALGIGLGLIAGLTSGLFGIGGGLLVVPIMTLILAIPIHIAAATSLFMMVATSSVNTVVHASIGNILFEFVPFLAAGVVGGAQIGAWGAKRVTAGTLRRSFGILMLFVGLRLSLSLLSL